MPHTQAGCFVGFFSVRRGEPSLSQLSSSNLLQFRVRKQATPRDCLACVMVANTSTASVQCCFAQHTASGWMVKGIYLTTVPF